MGRDERPVEGSRDPKSISTEDTFAVDLTDRAQLQAILRRDAGQVASRLARAGLFARTVTVKVRFADFTTRTIARGLGGATDSLDEITSAALTIFDEVDPRPGVRLLGIGVSNFATSAQEKLFGTSRLSTAGRTSRRTNRSSSAECGAEHVLPWRRRRPR
nr:hypothetical protein [Tessaracoccus coleopterorum]